MKSRALKMFYRRHSFTLAFIIIGAVVVGVGAFVVGDMRRGNQEVQHMYSDMAHDFDSTLELQYQTQEARRSMLYALTTTDSNRQLDSRAAEAHVRGTVLSHEIFDRIAGLTQVPLAALCDKVKPSMLNHSRR